MSAGAAFLANYQSALKEWYELQGDLVKQFNDETEIIGLFKKATVEWQGKVFVIPIDVERHGGVGFIGPSGQLPTAGHAEPKDLRGTSGVLAVRGQIDRELIKAAPSKGMGSFISAIDFQYEKMKEQALETSDLKALFGGLTKGYINERKPDLVTIGGFVGGGASGASAAEVQFEYSGDFSIFKARGLANSDDPSSENYKGLIAANTNTWIRAKIVRTDTYAEIVPAGGGAAVVAIFFRNFDEDLAVVSLSTVADVLGANFTTNVGAVGRGFAVEAHQTQLVDGLAVKFGGIIDVSTEPLGVFSNLSTQAHLTQDRTTATGLTVLQAPVLTQVIVAPQARATLSVKRVQAVKDQCVNKVGMKSATLDFTVMNPLQRQAYIGILTATVQYITNNGKNTGDPLPSDSNLSLGGEKLRTARHCPRSMLLFLSTKWWKLVERDPASFINEDGNVLSRVPGFNALEMAWTWSYNHVCIKPAANGILIGFSLE